MTVKTNFLQGSSYNAPDLVNEFGALFTDGMLSGGAVTQHSTPNLSVDVTALKCIKSGLFLISDSTVNVAITANTSGYNRIDVIAVDLDSQAIIVVQGTASSSPTVPILTGNKIALAQVLVGNNVSVINTTNITDVRTNADLFGNQLAGKADKNHVGKVPAFTWTGIITGYNGSGPNTIITHNLGYKPIVVIKGTVGAVILTVNDNDNNSVQVFNYAPAGNNWAGSIYFY